MNIGKVPENILKRSILKKISKRRSEVLLGATLGEDCAVLTLSNDDLCVLTTDPVTAINKDYGKYAINNVCNDLFSTGSEPIGVLVILLLPIETEESTIKKIMDELELEASKLNLEILGGHSEITDAVIKPVITVTGVGKAKKEKLVSTKGAAPGDDIVVTKWIGLEGTAILASEYEQKLLEKFPARMVYEAKEYDRYLSVANETAPAVKSGVTAMHDVSEGGIFAALWSLASASHVGLEADLKKIPIKQETIEICNFFDLNPYCLMSAGSLLITCKNGEKLIADLAKEGIPSAVIGTITNSNDKVIINGENKRFLDLPKTDEIYKIKERI